LDKRTIEKKRGNRPARAGPHAGRRSPDKFRKRNKGQLEGEREYSKGREKGGGEGGKLADVVPLPLERKGN